MIDKQRLYLIGVFVRPAINTVVCSIQATFGEPLDITGFKSSVANGVERTMPIKSVPSHLPMTRRVLGISTELKNNNLGILDKTRMTITYLGPPLI